MSRTYGLDETLFSSKVILDIRSLDFCCGHTWWHDQFAVSSLDRTIGGAFNTPYKGEQHHICILEDMMLLTDNSDAPTWTLQCRGLTWRGIRLTRNGLSVEGLTKLEKRKLKAAYDLAKAIFKIEEAARKEAYRQKKLDARIMAEGRAAVEYSGL